MTFLVQKPGGWTDDIDTITGQQITNIDVNLSNAIDGGAGGPYNPTGPLTIDGAGMRILNGVSTVMNGPIVLQGDEAGIRYRVDRTTIIPDVVATTFIIDTSNDIYVTAAPCGNTCDVALNITDPFGIGFIDPVEGQRLILKKLEVQPLLDVSNLFVRQDIPTGPILLILPDLAVIAPPMGNRTVGAEFVFNGTANLWEVLRCHEQCTI